jgi:hypothetical protein
MAHNQEEFDKHSNDNSEILHTDTEIKTLPWCEPSMTTYTEGYKKRKILEIFDLMQQPGSTYQKIPEYISFKS